MSSPFLAALSLKQDVSQVWIDTTRSLLNSLLLTKTLLNLTPDDLAISVLQLSPGRVIQDGSCSTYGTAALSIDSLCEALLMVAVLAQLAKLDGGRLLGEGTGAVVLILSDWHHL